MFIQTAVSRRSVRTRHHLRRRCEVNVLVLDHLQEFHGLARCHVFHVLVQLIYELRSLLLVEGLVACGSERDQAILADLNLRLMPMNESSLIAPLHGRCVERLETAMIPMALLDLLLVIHMLLRVDELLVRFQKVLFYCLGSHQIIDVT